MTCFDLTFAASHIPFNELNRAFDLGFKPLPHGDNCYLPARLQLVGRLEKSMAGTSTASQPSASSSRANGAAQARCASEPTNPISPALGTRPPRELPELLDAALNTLAQQKA